MPDSAGRNRWREGAVALDWVRSAFSPRDRGRSGARLPHKPVLCAAGTLAGIEAQLEIGRHVAASDGCEGRPKSAVLDRAFSSESALPWATTSFASRARALAGRFSSHCATAAVCSASARSVGRKEPSSKGHVATGCAALRWGAWYCARALEPALGRPRALATLQPLSAPLFSWLCVCVCSQERKSGARNFVWPQLQSSQGGSR